MDEHRVNRPGLVMLLGSVQVLRSPGVVICTTW